MREPSADYPLNFPLEAYDIERDKEVLEENEF